MDIFEMHAVIKGDVQGVGFRATTQYHARKMGIAGTVRNLTDGSVEIRANGPKEKLNALLKKLTEESFPGHIQDTVVEYTQINNNYQDFKIVY